MRRTLCFRSSLIDAPIRAPRRFLSTDRLRLVDSRFLSAPFARCSLLPPLLALNVDDAEDGYFLTTNPSADGSEMMVGRVKEEWE